MLKLSKAAKTKKSPKPPMKAQEYRHVKEQSLLRPDVGTQAQFKKKKPPKTYRYDSSLSPAMDWDGQNGVRELGEWLLACIRDAAALPAPHTFPTARHFQGPEGKVFASVDGLQDAVERLERLSKPFLNWAGKAERLSFDVPTLPLFVHERLSTRAIIETLQSHRKKEDATQGQLFDLYADPQQPIHEQILRAYEHRGKWVNRMILGDSLVVMNSLVQYEGLGGQVQMIYMDPPYGVKFGSNFQPFVRKREVAHNDDADFTREPEMVKAYRDTWECGLHSYLAYMRDRLLLCRDLLATTGSIFVQIGDGNVHHLRELMDEIFGADNYLNTIPFVKTSGVVTKFLANRVDFLLWYARNKQMAKGRPVYLEKSVDAGTAENYDWLELEDGSRRGMTKAEKANRSLIPAGAKIYKPDNIASQGNAVIPFEFGGNVYSQAWKTNVDGLRRLAKARRLHVAKNSLQYVRYLTDFPCVPVTQLWDDTATGSFTDEKIFAVQTGTKTIERCIHMTTDPGDLVLDPTCGSGTTAYASEKWGRRWITVDVSRVPLALARQRILTATFPWHRLQDSNAGPAGGFIYERKQNNKGEEVGGIVPHVMLENIANDEPPKEEVLVDRPEPDNKITRVSGPFWVEATIPTPVDWEGDGIEDSGMSENHGAYVDRMIEVLRRSPVLQVGGDKPITLKHVRVPAKALTISAEAVTVNGDERPVAIVFGPESGAVSEKLVYEAAREAHAKQYSRLFVVGFAIQPNARQLVEGCEQGVGVPATYVQATPDLVMADLLKTTRSSQIFSVCGMPECELRALPAKDGENRKYQVRLKQVHTFDPVTMEVTHMAGDDVPAWLLDTDYNGLCFHVSQAFFPRTSAWESLKKALKATHEESVWEHLAGAESAPFDAGEHGQIAVKVIDDRGNELLVVMRLEEAV